jgi:hypothetical protein
MTGLLALAATNFACTLVLAGLFALGATGRLSPVAYQVGLIGLGALAVALWARVEQTFGRGHGAFRRIATAAAALPIAIVATPALVLMPLFALEGQMPAEAGFRPVVAVALESLRAGVSLLVALNLLAAVVVAISVRHRARHGRAR